MITFTIGQKAKHKPWVDNDILDKIQRKNLLAFLKDHFPTEENMKKYRRIKKECDELILKAKQQYYHQRIEDNITNPRKIWRIMSDIAPSMVKTKSNKEMKLSADESASFFARPSANVNMTVEPTEVQEDSRCASSHVNVNSFSMAVAIFFLAIQLG